MSKACHPTHKVHKPVTDVTDKVFQLMDAGATGKLGLVQFDDHIVQELIRRGDAEYKLLPCDELCYHLANRQEDLGNPTEVRNLASDVKLVGFSQEACSHALCGEAEPGGETLSEKNTVAWIAASTVPLASVVKGSIKHHTLACSTFTQAMRCIRYKVASADKKLGNGRHYDVETIRATDAAMADAFDKGIKWLVLKLPLQFLYPGLFGRLSQARNVAGHIQRSTHEVQGISSMWSMWSQQLAEPEGELDLAVIKRAINQQKPWFSAYLDAFYAFLYSNQAALQMACGGKSS